MSAFEVEVVFAMPAQQCLKTVLIRAGATVAEVIQISGMAGQFEGHGIDTLAVGIWGQKVPRSQIVEKGDRIEIYRALQLDPREARRRLALCGETMRGAKSG